MIMSTAICGIINLSNLEMTRFSTTGSMKISLAPGSGYGEATLLAERELDSISISLLSVMIVVNFNTPVEKELIKNERRQRRANDREVYTCMYTYPVPRLELGWKRQVSREIDRQIEIRHDRQPWERQQQFIIAINIYIGKSKRRMV
jgi:hypothetical protein